MRKRRLYLVRDGLERRYLRLIFMAAAIPTLMVAGCMYYIIFTLLAEHIAIPEFVAQTLLPVVDKVNIMLVIFIPIVFAAIVIEGLILTHKLTGPIERIEKELDSIARGDIEGEIRVRAADHLKPLVDGINKLLERVRKAEKKS